MKVKMKVSVSGPRHDGGDWPRMGVEMDVPDWEGAELCASGLAVPVVEEPVEKAVAPEPEKRRPGRPRKTEEE